MNKPMKGVDCLGSLDKLTYPKYLQPKYDGIRIIFEDGVAWSASLKPLRNKEIQKIAEIVPSGLECEYYIPPSSGGLRTCASTCNSAGGGLHPDGKFFAFDIRNVPLRYDERLGLTAEVVSNLNDLPIETAPTMPVSSATQVEAKLKLLIADGYEGAMLKDPNAYYKHGRSTLRSQECLKLKPFLDAEAYVIGYRYEQENTNDAFTNELGHTTRSSSKLGKFDKPLIGALHVQSPLFSQPFWVSGFTHDLKERMFYEQDSLIGRVITFKYQPCEVYDLPRHPIFKGFRPMQD